MRKTAFGASWPSAGSSSKLVSNCLLQSFKRVFCAAVSLLDVRQPMLKLLKVA